MRKKIMTLIMIFISVFTLVSIKPVFAENGPSASGSGIELYKDGEDWIEIYEDGVVNNEAISGVTYDEATNKLTLNNFKSSYELNIYEMGDDFKLNLVGDNEVTNIYVCNEHWNTNLNITGNGSLTINRNKEYPGAIGIINGKIIVDDTVTLKMYSPETFEGYGDFVPFVIGVRFSDIEDGNEVIIFKNRSNLTINSEREWGIGGVELIKGLAFKNATNPRNYTIVEKNNKKYGMYSSDTNYIVTGSEIKYDDINDLYFIDSSDEKADTAYSSLSEVEEEYTNTHEIVNITKEIVTYNSFIYLDEDENEYAVYIDYSNDEASYIFDITDENIVLANGETYVRLKINDNLNIDDLTSKVKKEYQDTFEHYLYSSELIIHPNSYEFIEGANQTYIIGQNNLIFKISADYSLFENGGKVYVDGKEITDYKSESGSTVIKLSKEYANSLKEGEHTLKVVFNNDKSVSTTFTVSKMNNPNTGDNIIFYIIIFGLSILSLIGIVYYKKKTTKN